MRSPHPRTVYAERISRVRVWCVATLLLKSFVEKKRHLAQIFEIIMAGDDLTISLKEKVPSAASTVSCSVCLEAVTEDVGERSIAKLKCGHHFHLDCIGSAFNAKGRMQCPNCRQVELGQWLYANGCFLHEEFVDDYSFEDDFEAFEGAANLRFSPAHWCPHQGSFAQLSLSFEELDNLSSGYVDLRQGSRANAAVQICPYLASQGLSLGGPSPHADNFFSLHGSQQNRSSGSMRRGASFHSSQRNFGQQQASAISSSMQSSFEGSSQSYPPVAGFLQPNSTRQRTLGFLVGSSQSMHARVNQGSSMSSAQFLGQQPVIQSTQVIPGNAHSYSHTANSSRIGFVDNRQARQSEVPSTPQRASPSEFTWTSSEPVHEFTPPLSSTTTGQPSSPGDALGWTPPAEGLIDPWGTRVYVPQPSMGGSSHWWAWVPPANSHGQRVVGNATLNSFHHEGQFFSGGLFARPRATPAAGFSEQPAEGSYTWGYTGFL